MIKYIVETLTARDLKNYIIKEVVILMVMAFCFIGSYSFYQNKVALKTFAYEYINKYSHSMVSSVQSAISESYNFNDIANFWINPISSINELTDGQIDDLVKSFQKFEYLAEFDFVLANGDIINLHYLKLGERMVTENDEKVPLNAQYCLIKILNNNQKDNAQWEYYNSKGQLLQREVFSSSGQEYQAWYKRAKSQSQNTKEKGDEGQQDIKQGVTKQGFSKSLFSNNRIVSNYKNLKIPQQQGGNLNDNISWAYVSSGIDVNKLSRFLSENSISRGCLMFLINRDNNEIIAAGSNPKDQRARSLVDIDLIKESYTPIKISGEKEKIINQAFQVFSKDKQDQFEMEYNGESFVVSFNALSEVFRDLTGVQWDLLIIVPFNDIFNVFSKSQKDTLGIYLFALILIMLRIFILSRKISDPIEELNEEAKKVERFDFEGEVINDSKITEVKNLATTIQTMKLSLRSFTKYMPRKLVMRLLQKNQDIALGGEAKKLTIFFSDIEGFTSVSEGLTPTNLMRHISDYFEHMTEIVLSEQGTIDKYIGDSIMAFWGAPDDVERPSLHACRSALLCLHKLRSLNQVWIGRGRPPLNTRFGIHCGEVVVGNMGSSERMNYTIIGDAVNLSSRLEGTNKLYKTNIIISHDVYEEVKKQFLCRPLDIVAVKGKNQGVKIYELLGQFNGEEHLRPTAEEVEFSGAFEKGFSFYINMNWEKALQTFKDLQGQQFVKETPSFDATVAMYIERCKEYIKSPPEEGWDGVCHLKTK